MRTGNGQFGKRFQDQVALVVGGAQGIGKAIAVALAKEGARVVIADIDRKMMLCTSREAARSGYKLRRIACDVRRSVQVETMVERLIGTYGRIDILMHVAGVSRPVAFTSTSEEHWDWVVDTNLKGAFLVARAVVPHMIKRHRGKLIFMASTNSWDAEAGLAPYNASKAGVYLLAKTLAREVGPYGINSNALAPGFIRTRLTEPLLQNREFLQKYCEDNHLIPLGRLGLPEDVAGPALFLASSDADYVNGALIFVDGGQLA